MRSFVLLLVLGASVVACQERARAPFARSSDSVSTGARFAAPRRGADRNARPVSVSLAEVVVSGEALPPLPAESSATVIRTAEVSIEVDTLESAIARIRRVAAQFGGYVAGTNITSGRKELRNARLEVKIPATRFEESLSGLEPIGRLESVSVEAEDVGEQFVDVAGVR